MPSSAEQAAILPVIVKSLEGGLSSINPKHHHHRTRSCVESELRQRDIITRLHLGGGWKMCQVLTTKDWVSRCFDVTPASSAEVHRPRSQLKEPPQYFKAATYGISTWPTFLRLDLDVCTVPEASTSSFGPAASFHPGCREGKTECA